ncbi:MAG TPA: glycosyltransferase family 4 protein [Thermodesulfovibrionales bacterium]|nr:glycosyltransferase family 4 protein [Thermodesulfovibrionales bacterium]
MFTVLHTESSKGWGGQENRILKEAKGLQKLGVRVIVLCQPGSILEKNARSEGIEVRTCTMGKHYNVVAISSILRLMKREKIDVVSTHSGRDSFLAGIAGRISRRRPLIVRTRHIAMPITTRITYRMLPHVVVTTSEYVRQYLIRKGIAPEKVVTIHTGIDLSVFNPDSTTGNLREDLGLKQDIPLIGTVAILRFKKGHHILLDAVQEVLKEIPEAVFVFAGDGPQKNNIERKINSMGLTQKVLMLGLRKDVPGVLKSLDIFVLPTLQESHGGVFVEAMAMGRPVIGTDVGGVGEVIQDGINGYLVRPNDVSALAGAMISMLRDKERTALMGREGRKMVQEGFTIEGMCEKTYALYSSLLARKRR